MTTAGNHTKEALSPGQKPRQQSTDRMSTRPLSFIPIPFSSLLTLVYNLIAACPDFASLQTSIPNPSVLPSHLYFIVLLGYSSRSLLFSETLNGFSQLTVQSSHFLSWPPGTSTGTTCPELPPSACLRTPRSHRAALLPQQAHPEACGSLWASRGPSGYCNYVQNSVYIWVSALCWKSSHLSFVSPNSLRHKR